MKILFSGPPMRLVTVFCALVLMIAPALPCAPAFNDGPATGAQSAPDIDNALTAQPLVIAPSSLEGEADARARPRRSAVPALSQTGSGSIPRISPACTRVMAFRARAPPAPV